MMTEQNRRQASLAPVSLIALIFLCLGWSALAQNPAATAAATAYQNKEWADAVEGYEQITKSNPENAAAWFRLGRSLQELGKSKKALAALEKARSLGYNEQATLFVTSRSHAALGHEDKAMEMLGEVSALGKSRLIADGLQSAPEFKSWMEEGKLSEIVAALTPCSEPVYRQFDFWLGDWSVESPNGQNVGQNEVTSHLGGCLLIEDWTSAAGGQEGMSFNYYDASDGTWNQIYIDNTGNVSQWPPLKGGLEDGVMVLESPGDAEPRSRWRWQHVGDSRVRQWAETSSDQGETWTTVWDSYYVLK